MSTYVISLSQIMCLLSWGMETFFFLVCVNKIKHVWISVTKWICQQKFKIFIKYYGTFF